MSGQALDAASVYVNLIKYNPDLTLFVSAYDCQGSVYEDLTVRNAARPLSLNQVS